MTALHFILAGVVLLIGAAWLATSERIRSPRLRLVGSIVVVVMVAVVALLAVLALGIGPRTQGT